MAEMRQEIIYTGLDLSIRNVYASWLLLTMSVLLDLYTWNVAYFFFFFKFRCPDNETFYVGWLGSCAGNFYVDESLYEIILFRYRLCGICNIILMCLKNVACI